MSHFSLIIVSGKKLSEESLGVTMNPFFESSDPEDENVQFFQMDNNEDALKEFVKHDKDPEYPTFDTFLEKYYGYKKNESGYYGYWKNPQAKWDWYEVGGRFANHLVSKSGMIGDSFMVQDLDFEIMAKEKKSNAESVFDDSKKEDSATRFFKYGIKKDETREMYVARRSVPVNCFAFVVDGEWVERGSMGWWGCVSDEKDPGAWVDTLQNLVKSLRPEQWLTVVDCHI